MLKKNNDVFTVNEIIGNTLTDLIIEGDLYIPESLHSIEKVLLTSGKVKLNNISAINDRIAVYGELKYTVIFRGTDSNYTVQSCDGKIDFTEEIPLMGVTEKMSVRINPIVDYIDSKIISDRKVLVKAVIGMDVSANNTCEVNYISSIESDGNLQAKTDNISYTGICSTEKTNVSLNEFVTLENGIYEVSDILKVTAVPKIIEAEIMNERMLIEGMCDIGILYADKGNYPSVVHTCKQIPFTCYLEAKNSENFCKKHVKCNVTKIDNFLSKDDNDEIKVLNIDMSICVSADFYCNFDKNLIVDAYSTTSDIETSYSSVNLSSVVDFLTVEENFEKTFDAENAMIKDVFYHDANVKISEKNLNDNNLNVDGFIDVNLLILNGETNNVDSLSSSVPFSMSIDLSKYDDICDVDINIFPEDFGAYRKGLNTILIETKLICDMCIKNNKTLKVISDMTSGEKLNQKNTPAIVLRAVQQGETMWDIAKNYNISLKHLCKLNDLDQDCILQQGEKLLICKEI